LINKKLNNNRRKNRPNGRRGNFTRNNDFEPNNHYKPKGSATKVLEKYLNLAQDASSNGDRIKAEGYYQYAEHYQRIINSNNTTKEVSNKSNFNSLSKDNLNRIKQEENKELNLNQVNDFQNNLEVKDSRTQRSLNGKMNRLKKNQTDEKHQIKKDVTSDGVEALKAFSTSIDEVK
tara:strand:- start:25 stop:552 length:528 start_codon:yes stop_codon:yes gene_type:complete